MADPKNRATDKRLNECNARRGVDGNRPDSAPTQTNAAQRFLDHCADAVAGSDNLNPGARMIIGLSERLEQLELAERRRVKIDLQLERLADKNERLTDRVRDLEAKMKIVASTQP